MRKMTYEIGNSMNGIGKVMIMLMGKKSSEGISYHLPATLAFFVILKHKSVLNLQSLQFLLLFNDLPPHVKCQAVT